MRPTSPTERLVLLARQQLGDAMLTLNRCLELAVSIYPYSTAPSEEGRIKQVCIALHELLDERKSTMTGHSWKDVNVMMDSLIPVFLTQTYSTIEDLQTMPVTEEVTVGCFRSLWGVCISQAAVRTVASGPATSKLSLPSQDN